MSLAGRLLHLLKLRWSYSTVIPHQADQTHIYTLLRVWQSVCESLLWVLLLPSITHRGLLNKTQVCREGPLNEETEEMELQGGLDDWMSHPARAATHLPPYSCFILSRSCPHTLTHTHYKTLQSIHNYLIQAALETYNDRQTCAHTHTWANPNTSCFAKSVKSVLNVFNTA